MTNSAVALCPLALRCMEVRDRLITQEGSRFFHYGKNFVAHLYRTHGRIRDSVTRRTEPASHTFRPWKGHVVYFRQVMVRRGQPEDRNGVDSRGGSLLRQF